MSLRLAPRRAEPSPHTLAHSNELTATFTGLAIPRLSC